MPRHKLRFTPTEGEQKALDAIKRIHQDGGRTLKPAEERKLLKRTLHVTRLPGFKVRVTDGKLQFKGMGFGKWREHMPIEYENAKAERDYLVDLEKAKIKRPSGGAEARKAQGVETRRRALRAWESSTLPEHNRCAAIAGKLGLSARRVQQIIKSTPKTRAE